VSTLLFAFGVDLEPLFLEQCFVHGVAPPRFTLTYRVFLLPIDFSRPMVLLSVFFLTARETSAPVWFLIYAPERSNSVV
jgi:hypothetical protein